MLRYSDSFIRELLKSTKTIAVVGISANEARPSHSVAKYLIEQGYTVIPVNPVIDSILGQKCYPSLGDIPVKVDMVDCFRAPEHIPELVNESIQIRTQAIWMQLGLEDAASCQLAESKGLKVIQDLCIKIEHQRLFA